MSYIEKSISIFGTELQFLQAFIAAITTADSRITCTTNDLETQFGTPTNKPTFTLSVNEIYTITFTRYYDLRDGCDGYTVTSSAFGDSVSYEFPVHVRDKSSPLFIYLSQYVVYCSLNSNFDPMRYVRETSNDLVTVQTPYDLSIRSNVDTSNPGVYEVEYTLSGETTSTPAITYLVVIVLEE